jgi:hypothetical protein
MHKADVRGSRVVADVIYIDLHSDLSLEHCWRRGCSSLIVESEGKWRKHTVLEISNLRKERNHSECHAKYYNTTVKY